MLESNVTNLRRETPAAGTSPNALCMVLEILAAWVILRAFSEFEATGASLELADP
jgi:hypothetical protein